MSETVFILGAGASQNAGVPLMNEFLTVAEKLWRDGRVSEPEDSFGLVFKAISSLQAVHSKAALSFENIESAFAAFEMARLIGRLGDLSAEEIERLPTAMRVVISRTIEETAKFPVVGGQIHAAPPYPELAAYVAEAPRRDGPAPVSLITFNYDICLDYALQGTPVDYCLDTTSVSYALRVLKLHGSLNWCECPTCKRVVAWPMQEFFRHRYHTSLAGQQDARIRIGSSMPSFKHCPGQSAAGPYVVPPTWNKFQYHSRLEPVWRAAAEELSEARNIFVCGYSLPPTDEFFRYLYALGTVGRSLLQRFWVFDPDESVGGRFKELLGQAARTRFKYFKGHFEGAVHQIITTLKEDAAAR